MKKLYTFNELNEEAQENVRNTILQTQLEGKETPIDFYKVYKERIKTKLTASEFFEKAVRHHFETKGKVFNKEGEIE